MNFLNLSKQFVEGEVELQEVLDSLYKSKEAEDFLKSLDPVSPYSDLYFNNYDYLISLSSSNNNDCIDAQDFLFKLLSSQGVLAEKSDMYIKLGRLLATAIPKQVNPSVHWIKERLGECGERSNSEIKDYIKKSIANDFKYIDKPPKWLQEPNWPIIDGRPGVFMGQKKNSSKHDVAFDYFFKSQLSLSEVVIVQIG